jgi:hypothetical protein
LYADAVGLATVVLPTGWQERLVPLTDEEGNVHAYCLEVYDTCVSKLMAGREKDFAFIKELLDRGLMDIETFVARAELVADMPQSNALSPRIEKLEAYRKAARPAHDVRHSTIVDAPRIIPAAKLTASINSYHVSKR